MTPERLKEIKQSFPHTHAMALELVAEVERLQAGDKAWEEIMQQQVAVTAKRRDERDSLAAKLAVAREALGWYAAIDNWTEREDRRHLRPAHKDAGTRARTALARIDGDGTDGRGE